LKIRKLTRLKPFDYTQNGAYFVTICTRNQEWILGNVIDGKMIMSDIGKIAKNLWLSIPDHFQEILLDEFIIMPNHIHGIIIIQRSGSDILGNEQIHSQNRNENIRSLRHRNEDIRSLHRKCWHGAKSGSLSSIVRGFKIGVTNWCQQNGIQNFAWQKSFYDHIIQNDESFNNFRNYIKNNPLKWEFDKNKPQNLFM
jgi:putative transposase